MSSYDGPLEAREVAAEVTEERRPNNAFSTVLSKGEVGGAGGVKVYGFHVYSTKATAQWVMAFEAVKQPANGTVTALTWSIGAQDYLDVLWIPARFFDQGLWICNSTTDTSLTLGAADCLFDVQWSSTY